MKTRVVKENNRYYPEYRFCFIWFRFIEPCWNPNFGRLEHAQQYIDAMMKSKIKQREIMPYKTFCKRTDYTGPK